MANKYLDLNGLTVYHNQLKTTYLSVVDRVNTGTDQSPNYRYDTKASTLRGTVDSSVILGDGVTATTQAQGDNSRKVATTAYVHAAVDALPEPMVFKGTVGTGGTITALPVNGTATVGDTYKVITNGTYAGEAAKVGDTFICNSKTSSANTWVLIPSGDEPSGTVTSVGVESVGVGAAAITVPSTPITTSGTITLTVNPATSSAFGVVQTGDNITNTNGVISVAKASNSAFGVVKYDGTIIKGGAGAGEITVETATNSDSSTSTTGKLGVVRGSVETGVIVTDGTLSIQTITNNEITALFTSSGN